MVTEEALREAYASIVSFAQEHDGSVTGMFRLVGCKEEDLHLAMALALKVGIPLLEPASFGMGFLVALIVSGSTPMEVQPLSDKEIEDLLGGPPTT